MTTEKKPSKTVDLVIQFHNEAALKAFALWLCESGEQGYWEFVDELPKETREKVLFSYHGEENRGQTFMPDNIIRTRKY